MRVNDELWVLRQFGVSPTHYLVLPRVSGMLLASFLLAVYLAVAALVTAAIMISGTNAFNELRQLADSLPLATIVSGLAKTALFGLVVAAIACRAGMRVDDDLTEIPRAASRAVVSSLLTVFVLDALWGML
jgi:phospholipid/cholesterol/gamma-HCH transport system permease protein